MAESGYGLNVVGHYYGSSTSLKLKLISIAPDIIVHNDGVVAQEIFGVSPNGDKFMVSVLYKGVRELLNIAIQGSAPTDEGREAAKRTIEQIVNATSIDVSPAISTVKHNSTNGLSQQ